MRVDQLDFHLPEELIAQYPSKRRDHCHLLYFNRKNSTIKHSLFNDIINYLNKDDILIFNNTKVFAARLFGKKKETQANIEIFLLERKDDRKWKALIKPAKRIKGETEVLLDNNVKITVKERLDDGQFIVEFDEKIEYKDFEQIGEIPLPPYIKREVDHDLDDRYYQTVYAEEYGAVAAPTAGFHFTDELIKKLQKKGVRIGFITLHISYATFAPIRTEHIEDHQMHSEHLIIPQETVDLINNKSKGRVIAVGTTVVRGLESAVVSKGEIKVVDTPVNTFIYPGYEFKIVDSIITNFHLPKSTLLLLVGAFIGLERLKELYQKAIDKKYRFFSYGDAMMIE